METPVILIADRANDDVIMLRLALLGRNLQCDLRHLSDGQEAIDYLNGTSQYSDRESFPFPAVTILDFQLADRSGLEVLSWARKQPRFKDHPIVMLSGAAGALDIERASQLMATRCIEKTADCTELVDFIEPILPRAPAAKAA